MGGELVWPDSCLSLSASGLPTHSDHWCKATSHPLLPTAMIMSNFCHHAFFTMTGYGAINQIKFFFPYFFRCSVIVIGWVTILQPPTLFCDLSKNKDSNSKELAGTRKRSVDRWHPHQDLKHALEADVISVWLPSCLPAFRSVSRLMFSDRVGGENVSHGDLDNVCRHFWSSQLKSGIVGEWVLLVSHR